MATPSRRDQMIKNLMKLHRKKTEKKLEEDKPKDPEGLKKIQELWLKLKRKKND